MKKVLSVLLVIIIVFSFCSCGTVSSDKVSSDNSSAINNNKEPLNAQNLISRLKDSDGVLYCIFDGSACALYFVDGNSKFKITNILDIDTLGVDYSRLSNANGWIFEAYNDAHFSISMEDWDDSISYELAYSDPENRFVLFSDSNYKEGDSFSIFGDEAFTFMSKETMKSFIKGGIVLGGEYSTDKLEARHPSTVEGNIKLINDCIDAAN